MEAGKLIEQESGGDKYDQILRSRFNFTRRNSISLQQEEIKGEDGKNRAEV